MIEHTIRQAKAWASGLVAVSTDDPEVRRIAVNNGINPIKRPASLATDKAGKVAAIRHAWAWAENKFIRRFDVVIDLDCTNPMRRVEDIEAVYQLMVKEKPSTRAGPS